MRRVAQEASMVKVRSCCVIVCALLLGAFWAGSAFAQSCVTATSTTLTHTAIPTQSGTFTATFDASVTAAPTNDVVGLSSGAQTSIANFPVLISFSDTGHFVARNGGSYAATNTIVY